MQEIRYTDNQKKAHDLNRHISVTAGAGSGKTSVLVNRYLKILLEEDVRVRNVVAITFTEKAAAELKNRVTEKINELIEHGEAGLRKLRSIKEQLTSANISTIHSFCSRILREFAVEARVDAGFRIIHGIEQRMLLSDIIDDTLKKVAMQNVGNPQREKLANLLRIIGQDKLARMLTRLTEKRYEMELLRTKLYNSSNSELIRLWQDSVAEEFSKLIEHFSLDRLIDALNRVLTVAKGKNVPHVSELMDCLQTATGYSQVEIAVEMANAITTKSGSIAKRDFTGRGVDISEVESEIELLCDFANEVKKLPLIEQSDENLIEVTRDILEFYDLVMENYERAKIQSGQLDFEDLQLKVKNLLEDPWIRERLAEKYPYIMIDEYQDTNKLQYNILKPLVENYQSGNLFIVGDPKQSIYGFRDADVRVFDYTKREITEYQKDLDADFVWQDVTEQDRVLPLQAEKNEQQGELHLADSFRSLRDVVGFINLVFEDVMEKEKISEFDVDYEPLIKGRQNVEATGSVELILLPEKEKKGLLEPEIETESQHEIIAERIKQLVASEHQIWERVEGKEVPRSIKYQDIAILLRSRGNLPELELALDEAGIPFKIAGGIGFYQRQEIYDIYNYLQFLLNPHDDIALAGILRGPFFGISDAELYELSNCSAASRRALSGPDLWSKLRKYVKEQRGKVVKGQEGKGAKRQEGKEVKGQEGQSKINRAYDILSRHLQIADRVPVSVLIRDIFSKTGAIGVISAGSKGDQALGNYEKLLSTARDFERSGFSNLFDFIERMKILIDEEEREEQADIQLDSDAVQIMTVHSAKGLEFPVVILPYTNRRFRYDTEPFIDDEMGVGFSYADPENNYEKSEPATTEYIKERAKAKTIAEEKRIFYVATTRARDMLIISGEFPSQNSPSWMKWVCDALELNYIPDSPEIQRPVSITKLEQTEEESNRTVQDFQLGIKITSSMSDIEEYPELPKPARDIEESLEVNIEPVAAEPSGEILSVSQIVTYLQCPKRFYLQYRLGMPQLADSRELDSNEPEVDYYDNVPKSSKGQIVHDILEQLRSPQLDKSTLNRLFRGQKAEGQKGKKAKVETLSGEEELNWDEITRHVKNFIESDTGKRALSAEKQYHEATVNARLDEHIIAGKVDLLFVNKDGQFEIVDYKTDYVTQKDVEEVAEKYRNQMNLYALEVHKTVKQPEIDVTLFFTSLAYPYLFHYDLQSFEWIERNLREAIEQIQSKHWTENSEHCPDCPYLFGESCIL